MNVSVRMEHSEDQSSSATPHVDSRITDTSAAASPGTLCVESEMVRNQATMDRDTTVAQSSELIHSHDDREPALQSQPAQECYIDPLPAGSAPFTVTNQTDNLVSSNISAPAVMQKQLDQLPPSNEPSFLPPIGQVEVDDSPQVTLSRAPAPILASGPLKPYDPSPSSVFINKKESGDDERRHISTAVVDAGDKLPSYGSSRSDHNILVSSPNEDSPGKSIQASPAKNHVTALPLNQSRESSMHDLHEQSPCPGDTYDDANKWNLSTIIARKGSTNIHEEELSRLTGEPASMNPSYGNVLGMRNPLPTQEAARRHILNARARRITNPSQLQSTNRVPADQNNTNDRYVMMNRANDDFQCYLRQLEQRRQQVAYNLQLGRQQGGVYQPNHAMRTPSMPPNSHSYNQDFLYTGYPVISPYDGYNRLSMSQTTTGYMPQSPGHPSPRPGSAYATNGCTISNNYHLYRSENWLPDPASHIDGRKSSARVGKPQLQDAKSSFDDDEPLQQRVKRHPSVLSQASTIGSGPATNSATGMNDEGGHYSKDAITRQVAKLATTLKTSRLPLRQPTALENDAASPEVEEISFALPKYEIQRQPVTSADDIPSVKVSLPQMVREELLLSPDHAEQEMHLLLNLFMPAHQALTTPDPEPAKALLNFHYIAVMVIEAYIQFEIGDIQGLGRGHWHDKHDQSDTDYERVRDARDADTDEIFFAVLDRWRAGMESKKETLIRGAQEFCELALDIIFYIKEHGFLQAGPKPRSSDADQHAPTTTTTTTATKGKKKAGPAQEKLKGTKRPAAAEKKVTTLQGRKKAKVDKAPKAKKKAKPEVTVIKRK
ncbi:hypothetical protein ACN47E_005945 [Coniothyrium glycines]